MEAKNKINITIIGDSLIFRNGLRMLIETEKSFKVIGEAANIFEAAGLIAKSKPDVALINAAEFEGRSAVSFMNECCNDISTIVLANSDDPNSHKKYLLLGVNGVVTRNQGIEVLVKAIKHVHTSDLWFNREVIKLTIEQLLKEKGESPKRSYEMILTDRERDVLESVCQGLKNKAIADSLFIAETTVRHHLTSIFEKLNVKSRVALAIYAFNEGLVEVPGKNTSSAANNEIMIKRKY